MKRFSFLVIPFMIFSCSPDAQKEISSNSFEIRTTVQDSISQTIEKSSGDFIKYGVSFGECLGYCITETTYQKYKQTSVSKTWSDSLHFPTKIVTNVLSESDWLRLIELVDFDEFKRLPAKIGCPDCTDGGACWMEVAIAGKVHKVTYECPNPPEELAELVEFFER